MRNNRIQRSIRWGLSAVLLCTLMGHATAGAFTRGCAARDLQILTLIEERESTSTVTSEKLGDAMLTMLHARMVCHEGNVVGALALYESVVEAITPNPTVFGLR
jgi:hypothetical protein